MAIKKFEDIIAWQKAMDLMTKIFSYFGKSKNFAFRDQIMSASLSISSNIAEGFDRETDKEFRRFLYIAKGSCAEVKSLLYVAIRLKYLEQSHGKILISQCEEISKIIRGLIKSLKI